jgi:hypothetical protein
MAMSSDDGGFLAPGFSYYYVSHEVAADVANQRLESRICHVQVVPKGQKPMDAAGKAGAWLGKNRIESVTQLFLVGHGGPGSVTIGQDLTARNIAPLGGWLASFLDPTCRVRILGCASAADSMLPFGKFSAGQMHDNANDRPGYDLLYALARATRRITEGALNGQSIVPLGLKMGCRRVFPDGKQEHFYGGGIKDPF